MTDTGRLQDLFKQIADLLIDTGKTMRSEYRQGSDLPTDTLIETEHALAHVRNLVDEAIIEIGVIQDNRARRH